MIRSAVASGIANVGIAVSWAIIIVAFAFLCGARL